MNLFAPQSEQSKIELMMLADIKNHIISPKDSKPIVNLKQDALLGSYKFTSDLNQLTWKEAMNLLATTSIAKDILTGVVLPIDKKKTYAGRDIFSYLIPDKVNLKNGNTVIKNGQIMSGLLAKKELGGSKNNIPHLIIDSYDKNRAAQFMDDTQRITNNWLMSIFGFCVGLGDAIIPKELSESFKKYNEGKILEMQNLLTENENSHIIDLNSFEEIIYRELNNIMSTHAKTLTKTLDIKNNFFVMLDSGSKGKDINMGMIMGCIGQTAFGNKLVEKRFNNRTLSHFAKHDDSPPARGYIKSPYIDGSKATEFFFHQMDGRVGVIDTAIKSVTGDTELIIIEDNRTKTVRIGDWIDAQLENAIITLNTTDGEYREELKLTKKIYIPTTDLRGHTSWGEVTGITRHNPSETMYEIITHGGRRVTVTDSHSLLVWNKTNMSFERIEPSKVNFGDFVPVTMKLYEPPIIIDCVGNFKLNFETGLFMGIYRSHGICKNSSEVMIYSIDTIQEIVKMWLNSYKIPFVIHDCPRSYDTSILCYSEELVELLFNNKLDKFINAPLSFVRGYISGIISTRSIINNNFIQIENSEQFINTFNMFLARIGVFAKVQKNTLTIRSKWLEILKNDIRLIDGYKQQLLEQTIPSKEHRNFKNFNEVVLDKIISIKKVDGSKYNKVYDLTVPSTLNFGLANGLHVVDTADTGYMQKKTIKATEDVYLAYDGTVRNSINGIVQFIYGDNGYDTSKQMQVKSKLIMMDNTTVKSTYEFTPSELKEFSFDKKSNTAYVNEIISLRDTLRKLQIKTSFSCKKIDENYNLPFNLERVISYHINKVQPKKKTKITPTEIINTLEDFLSINKTKLSNLNKTHKLKLENDRKHKLLLRILINEYLAPKRILVEYNIGKETFNDIMEDLITSYNKNLAQSCEMVGILAAQSIGEPLTQFTLNTFHSTGVSDVTSNMSGMVRIKELISFSKNIKSPFMKIYLEESFKYDEEKTKLLSNIIENTMISDIILGTEIYFEPEHSEANSIHRKDLMNDNVKNLFFAANYSKNVSLKSLPWVYRFIINKEALLNKNITLLDIKTQFVKMWNEIYTELKGFKRKERDIITLVSNICILSNSDNDPLPVVHIRLDLKEYDYQVIMDILHLITNTFKIKGIKGIKKAFVTKEIEKTFDENGKFVDKTEFIITTQGINLDELFYLEGIDSSRTISNDVFATYSIYGIEATRSILLKEINEIFSTQASQEINYQHLSILVDIMTQNGGVTPLNRYGINKLETDPLSRASFEKTIEQLLQAAIYQEKDKVNSVSSRIITGRVIRGGTGMLDLLVDIDKLETTEYVETRNDTIGLIEADPFINDLFS
jgi:DNA-directed RNA polymerase beta' subunit